MKTAAPATSVQELIDPHDLANIDDLQLIARWVVEGFLHGLHRSPYVGFSIDFLAHREYLPGDDLRHLNWKLYGRHDKLYIKQYDAETNVDLHLVLDVSASMTGGEGKLSKLRYASILAASLGHLAARQRDTVGLTLFADRVVEHYQPRGTSDHLMHLLSALAEPRRHPRADSIRVLHEVAELMPRRGLVVVISDFYFDTDELLSSLDHFRHYGHDVLLFHILDPLEHVLNVDGAVRFVDLETGEQLDTFAHEIRQSFVAGIQQWLHELHQGCLAREMDHLCLVTDMPLERALFDYFAKRSQLY
jgi:uncharacterized protein (DUF58 family)